MKIRFLCEWYAFLTELLSKDSVGRNCIDPHASLAFLAHQLPQVLLIAERLRSGELGNVLVVLTKRRQPQFLQLLSKILTDVRSRLHNRCLGLRGFRVPFGS